MIKLRAEREGVPVIPLGEFVDPDATMAFCRDKDANDDWLPGYDIIASGPEGELTLEMDCWCGPYGTA